MSWLGRMEPAREHPEGAHGVHLLAVGIDRFAESPAGDVVAPSAAEDEPDPGLDLAHRGRCGERAPGILARRLEQGDGDVVLLAGFAVAELSVRDRCLAGPLVESGGERLPYSCSNLDVLFARKVVS